MEIDSEAFIQEVLNVHNKLRTDPMHYISALEDMASCFNGNMFSKPGRITLVTNEGVAAVNEAIEFLNKQSAIGKLSLSKALSKAAQDHASDIGKNNMAGHTGSDGSSMGDRVERYCNWSTALGENCQFGDTPDGAHEAVLQLLIDDGVASRGHRENIFNPAYAWIGIGVAPHGTYKQCCTIDYAGEVLDVGDDDCIPEKETSTLKKEEVVKPATPIKEPVHKEPAPKEIVKETTPKNIVVKEIIVKETHEETKDYGDGYVKIKDLPTKLVAQIEAMNLGDDVKIKNIGGEYIFEYFGKKYFPKSSSNNKAPSTNQKAPISALNQDNEEDEPAGYVSKNVSTKIQSINGKTTKITTKVYTFADGSIQKINVEEHS